jgi:hypothetical protein
MEKKLTAMQQAIDRIEKMISIKNFQKWNELKKEFLELEKQQIIDAIGDGIDMVFDKKLPYITCNDYYSQTFKTD